MFNVTSMSICALCSFVDDGGAARRSGLDGGLLLPHPHHCGQGGQQKVDKEPSVLIVTALSAACNKNSKTRVCVGVKLDKCSPVQRVMRELLFG